VREELVRQELVRQAQGGDAEAFDSLARSVGDRCLAIAVRILRDINLAEDTRIAPRSMPGSSRRVDGCVRSLRVDVSHALAGIEPRTGRPARTR
jgi:hypothetical protein